MSSKKVSRRNFLKAAAVGAAGAALAACQPPAPSGGAAATNPPAAANPPAKEKAKISFSMYGHPGLIEKMVPLFNQTHDNVELNFERAEGQGYWQKLAAAIAAGTAWDCFRGDLGHALIWGPKGAVLDVRSYMEQDKKYPLDGYIPGIIEDYTLKGKIYGVPTWCLTMWMFYNKKMFDEAGVKYPDPSTTWTDYMAMAKKLTKTDSSGKVTQFGANGWNSWDFPLFQVIWSNGGHFYYDDSMTKVATDDPKTIETLQMLADMYLVDKVVPNPSAPASSPVGILSDNVATEGNGDYLPQDNREAFMSKYEYIDATLCPSFNGSRANVYWPDSFQINPKTKYPDACYEWMSWFARDPAATEIQCVVVFPVYTTAYTDEAIASKWLAEPRPKGMIAQAKEHVKNAKLLRMEPHFSDIETVYYNEIGKLWSGEAKAEDVAKKIAQAGNEVMAKPVE